MPIREWSQDESRTVLVQAVLSVMVRRRDGGELYEGTGRTNGERSLAKRCVVQLKCRTGGFGDGKFWRRISAGDAAVAAGADVYGDHVGHFGGRDWSEHRGVQRVEWNFAEAPALPRSGAVDWRVVDRAEGGD